MRALIVAVAFVSVAGCEFPATKMVPVAPTQTQPEKQPGSTSTNEVGRSQLLALDARTSAWG